MMMEVKMVNQMVTDRDHSFVKVAISGSLLFFMCYFGLLFDVIKGLYTFPFYDSTCDCFSMHPQEQFTINVQWVVKDISIFIYSIVMALIVLIKPDFKMWGFDLMFMWVFFLVLLPVDYLMSYETNEFRIVIESFMMSVQVIYTGIYAKKYL